MLFEQILPHLRAGRRIQRSSWLEECVYNPPGYPKPFTKSSGTFSFGDLRREDILANDWRVYPADLPQEEQANSTA